MSLLKEIDQEMRERERRNEAARRMRGTDKVTVVYGLLNGETFQKNKFLRLSTLCIGDFVSQTKEKPVGFFIIRQVSIEEKKVLVEEVDCDPVHWKGDKNGRGHGPDEECKRKGCPYHDNCPISVHLMMMADVD